MSWAVTSLEGFYDQGFWASHLNLCVCNLFFRKRSLNVIVHYFYDGFESWEASVVHTQDKLLLEGWSCTTLWHHYFPLCHSEYWFFIWLVEQFSIPCIMKNLLYTEQNNESCKVTHIALLNRGVGSRKCRNCRILHLVAWLKIWISFCTATSLVSHWLVLM